MATLRLFTSNRLETLADALAEVIVTPLASPLEKEIIVVQSRGMERWVSMELARRHGICANTKFPFPNAFVNGVAQKFLPDFPDLSLFDPKIMTWRIMKLLPSLITKSGFESLMTYLQEPEENLKRFQLSERIADIFDQYLLFRPEMILKWEKGLEDQWQAVLWRALTQENETKHRALLGKAIIEKLADPLTQLEDIPERISVFGISTLPHFHLQVLVSLSRFTQMNLFLMNPCREYWADIVSDWEKIRTMDRGPVLPSNDDSLHMEKGNSLLASMGKLGREFFDMIDEFDFEDIPFFEETGEKSLLTCIQSDILNLRDRGQGSQGKKMVTEYDASVQIHSCHSPMREIEVLHDNLLKMFEDNPSLKPKDILVMAPDIESYAPYIQAVFDAPGDDSRMIPFSIADRSVKAEGRITRTFLVIMDLEQGRFSAPQVMTVLESRDVQRRLGFLESDLQLIQKWVDETRIRWGIDGKNRSEMGLPGLSENTWKAGIDRLLLGYALPGQKEKTFCDVLPYDNMEGSETSVLGKFIEFVYQLFFQVQALELSRNLDEWSHILDTLLETFFLPDEDTELEAHIIRSILNDLAKESTLSKFNDKVDVNVVRCYLRQRLAEKGFGFGFYTGGVTFCAMLPMRSIPFKTICLIGMNGDAYPRRSRTLSFDLMAQTPRKGDRSRRNDDRYLFLEAILSAREKLYVSYVGQDIRDNSVIPPSVVVSEVMDYIEQGFELKGKKILDHIVTKHRLQPFSSEYFKKGGRLFSYSWENFNAARSLNTPRMNPVPFISEGLPEPGEEWKTVSIDDVCGFFVNPAKYLLKKRLGIHLDEGAIRLEETEPFELKDLDRYLLSQNLLEKRLDGHDLKEVSKLIKAEGQLPHGSMGECIFHRMSEDIEVFAEKTRSFFQEDKLPPLEIDMNISDFRLTGVIDNVYPERLAQYRYAKIKPKDLLRIWIYHLTLNCVKTPGYPLISTVVGMDEGWTAWDYLPAASAGDILAKLLDKYWAGLIKPIHFFPESSWRYAQLVIERGKPGVYAMQKAYDIWAGNDFSRGESRDLYYNLCFKNVNPIDSEFQKVALEVFGPLIEHQREVEE